MNPADFQLAREVFADICDLTEAQQRAAIEERCAGRPEARRLVQAMVREDAADAFTLASATPSIDPEAVSAAFENAKLPSQIGRYRVMRVCGHGGMGSVYEAEQDNPRRRVALKMIRSVSASREVLMRFRREADMLGRLQHPGIGQIFEAGSTDLGDGRRPYFAMEFIEGQPLTRYANEFGLSSRDRLELMARVCDAVHYAHQRGIIHRDLKPANILVSTEGARGDSGTAIGQPKILDFGIARVTDSDVQNTMQTNVGQLIGTLQYMSPEQAAGDPAALDTRSDIYALGVLLYELLAGRLPYDLHEQSVPQSLRIIQENAPSTLSLHNSAYRGDVDTIVAKSLEKEPDRRYQSASELAEDIRRYLRNEPIAARRPSAFYQLRKFARRNRALVGGVFATIVTLAAGVIVSGVFAVRAGNLAAESRIQAYSASIVAAQALIQTDPQAASEYLRNAPPEYRNWEWRYLMDRLASALTVLDPGGKIVGRPVATEDGAILAMRSDGMVLRWDKERPDGRSIVARLGATVARVAFSADAGRVAIVTPDDQIRAHDLVDDTPMDVPALPGAGVVGVAWEGPRLIAVRPDRIATWSAVDGPERWTTREIDKPLNPAGATPGWYASEFTDFVAVPGRDRAILLWSARYYSAIVSIEISTGRVVTEHSDNEVPMSLALSHDGRQLAVGYEFRSVRILDAEALTETTHLGAHLGKVIGVAFSPDGKRLCSVGADGMIRVWDLAGPGPPALISAPAPRSPVFSADGSRVMCVGGSKPGSADRIRRFRLNNSGFRVLAGHDDYVYDVSYSRDGSYLAAGLYRSNTVLWDPRSGRRIRTLDTQFQPLFTADGSMVVLTDPIRRLDPATGDLLQERPVPRTQVMHWTGFIGNLKRTGTDETIWRTVYRSTPDDGFTLRAFANDALLYEQKQSGVLEVGPTPTPVFVGCPPSGLYSFDGRIAELIIYDGLLSASETSAVEAYLAERRASGQGALPAVSSAQLVAQFVADDASVNRDDDGVQSWTAANDSAIVLNRGGGLARIKFAETGMNGHPIVGFQGGGLKGMLPADVRLGDVTVFWLGNYEKSAGYHALYCIGMPGFGHAAWNLALRDTLGDLAGLRISYDRAFSPDGTLQVAVVGGAIGIAEVAGPARPASRRSRYRRIWDATYECVAFHPDGRLAVGTTSGTIEIWDVRTPEKLAELTGHLGAVYGLAFSPDGSRLVSGGNDTTVRLWDVDRLERVMELRGHEQYVRSVIFSPDGTQIASASGDGTVRLWEAPADTDLPQ